ncbi:MAG: hypothetical protein H7Z19_13800, partial [Chitinophagaceae bacterium]|nr:hypothetical protein [Rubrivivax sp.]
GQVPPYLIGNLAHTQRVLGQFEAALEGLVQMRAALVQGGGDPRQETYALAGQAQVLLRLGREAPAQAVLAEAQALVHGLGESLYASSPTQTSLLMAEAQLHLAGQRWGQAQAVLDRVIAATGEAALRNSLPVLAHLARAEATLHLQGPVAALAQAQLALEMALQMQHGLPHTSLVGQAWLALGRLHQQAGRHVPASAAYAHAMQHLVPTVGAGHDQALQALRALQVLQAQHALHALRDLR